MRSNPVWWQTAQWKRTARLIWTLKMSVFHLSLMKAWLLWGFWIHRQFTVVRFVVTDNAFPDSECVCVCVFVPDRMTLPLSLVRMESQLLFGNLNQEVVLRWSVGCFLVSNGLCFLLRPSTVLWCLSVNRYYILEKKVTGQEVGEMCGRRSFLAFCFLLFYAIWPCMISVQYMILSDCINRVTAGTEALDLLSSHHWVD